MRFIKEENGRFMVENKDEVAQATSSFLFLI